MGVCHPPLFHIFELKADDLSAGHHYTHFMDGAEIYVDSDGLGIYVDITGRRSLFVRPKKQQESMRRKIEKEIKNASDLEWLRYKVRGFFAERAARELGILELKRRATRTSKK